MIVYAAALGLVFMIAKVSSRMSVARVPFSYPRKFSGSAAMVGIVLISVAALRWHVGTDYWTYEQVFPEYVREVRGGLTWWGEPGIRILAWISNLVNGDVATLFALASIITVGLTVRTIWRWSPAFALSVAIYVLSGSWHGSFNAVRQYLACAILFAGHRYVVNRQLLRWSAVVAGAFLFHISAIVGLLLYLAPTKRIRLSQQILLLTLAIVAVSGASSLLDVLQQIDPRNADLGSYSLVHVNPLRVAFSFVPLVIYWMFPKSTSIGRDNAWFYVNMVFIDAAIQLASSQSALLARFVIYPHIFTCLAIPYLTDLRDDRERVLMRTTLIILFAIFWFSDISASPNLAHFQWIFDRY